ncbi:hypothetical protein [Micromonospora sp. NBS 11-29]|uniref:hypothetical protein n=1 Tax=Micromonospora sp. NBS 11-29 TaxID=1960879 RepID=UPI000B77E348|nr:hypothetical protein [Micromonospora sp. NBS 11-29]
MTIASPASASDLRHEFHSPYTGELLAVGTYDDLTDTYCIRHVSGHTDAILYSQRPDGSDRRSWRDSAGDGRTCSGNLSIPEDQYRQVWITAAEWRSPDRYHYT